MKKNTTATALRRAAVQRRRDFARRKRALAAKLVKARQ